MKLELDQLVTRIEEAAAGIKQVAHSRPGRKLSLSLG
jgi:hypothetical protein